MPSVAEAAPAPALHLHDVVETALAEALVLAARHQRLELVEQIVAELKARRERRGHVGPELDNKPARRGGG